MYEMWKRKQIHEDARKMNITKIPDKKLGIMGRRQLGGHDLVRRTDRQGEVLIRLQKVFGIRDAKNRTETDDRRKPEQMGTKECGKMMKRIQTLEDGRVPAKEAKTWTIEGQNQESQKKYQRLVKKFEIEGFMAEQGL